MNENNNNQTKIGILIINYFIQHLLDLVSQIQESKTNIFVLLIRSRFGCPTSYLCISTGFCPYLRSLSS